MLECESVGLCQKMWPYHTMEGRDTCGLQWTLYTQDPPYMESVKQYTQTGVSREVPLLCILNKLDKLPRRLTHIIYESFVPILYIGHNLL